MALGASRRAMVTLVMGEGARLIAIGLLAGIPLALATGHATGQLLFNVSPYDPWVLGAVLLLLATTGLLSTMIPAMRAARMQLAKALRYE